MTREYTVVWTYIANYGVQTVMATDPETAAKFVTDWFGEEFQTKARVYVFEGAPVLTKLPAKR